MFMQARAHVGHSLKRLARQAGLSRAHLDITRFYPYYLAFPGRARKAPVACTFELSYRCNLACVMCPQANFRKTDKGRTAVQKRANRIRPNRKNMNMNMKRNKPQSHLRGKSPRLRPTSSNAESSRIGRLCEESRSQHPCPAKRSAQRSKRRSANWRSLRGDIPAEIAQARRISNPLPNAKDSDSRFV